MRTRYALLWTLALGCTLVASSADSRATEYGFSTYGLGGNAFGAGVTPPAGTYVTNATAFYSGEIGRSINFGGVTINAGAKVDVFSNGVNVLYCRRERSSAATWVYRQRFPSDTSISTQRSARSLERSTVGAWRHRVRGALGWQHGDFAHTIYMQVGAPTGRWDPGFSPIIGLHRPGIDTGWAFTWTTRQKSFSSMARRGSRSTSRTRRRTTRAAMSSTSNGRLDRDRCPAAIGVVGYDTAVLETGSGARHGPFKGRELASYVANVN